MEEAEVARCLSSSVLTEGGGVGGSVVKVGCGDDSRMGPSITNTSAALA